MAKGTRKSLNLLTILVAFSSDFMKRGTYLFILLPKYAWYVKLVSFKTYLLAILQSPNFYVKNMCIMQNSQCNNYADNTICSQAASTLRARKLFSFCKF